MQFELATTGIELKLVEKSMPPWWGMAIFLPSLVVPPSYQGSLPFHLTLTLGWLYWVYSLYKLESVFDKLAPQSNVLPRRTWLVSAFIGSHPTNYLLLIGAFLITTFKQTPSSLALFIAIPVVLLLAFSWYGQMFAGLRTFINERLPEAVHVSRLAEYLIPVGLGGPAMICLTLQMLGMTPPWHFMSLIPIGMAAATAMVFCLQRKISQALVSERATTFMLEPEDSADWQGAQTRAEGELDQKSN